MGDCALKPHELTAGITDEALGPRQNVIPFDLDPDTEPHVCVFCEYRSSYPDMIRTVRPVDPDLIVWRCADSVACLRRRKT